VLCLVAIMVAALLAACGSSNSGTSTDATAKPSGGTASTTSGATDSAGAAKLPVAKLSDADLAKTINLAFGEDIAPSTFDPITTNALNVAGTTPSPTIEALAAKCVKQTTCDTGHGTIKVGILDPSATQNPWHAQARAVATQQALMYPDVKSVTFADGQNDDLAKTIAAYKGLISQHVDIITGTFDQGNALLPTTKLAAAAGILVVPFSNVMDKATGKGDIAADVTTDLCGYGNTLGKLASQGHTSGKVSMYTGTPGNPFGGTWGPCAQKTIKAAGLTSSLNNTNWTPQGEAQAAAALSANPAGTVATVYDYLPDGFFQKFLSLGKEPPTQVGGSAAYSTVALYQQLKAKYPTFTFSVAESQLFFPRIAVTAAIEKKLGGNVPLHIVPPQTVVTMDNYMPYYKANPGLPAAAQFSTLLSPALLKTTLGA
jgi:ABC-type sugar transport system substrate-binding protein